LRTAAISACAIFKMNQVMVRVSTQWYKHCGTGGLFLQDLKFVQICDPLAPFNFRNKVFKVMSKTSEM
jgi:hypothetical protein